MGDEKGFAAHAGFYPVAKAFIPKIESGSVLTGAPIIIFYGLMTPTATETKCRN